jgi:putative nucleotidyltransferase with HDIG domain
LPKTAIVSKLFLAMTKNSTLAAPTLLGLAPAPGAPFDFEAVASAYPILTPLKGSPHDPVHHREGDPFVHTEMVVTELLGDLAWRQLPSHDRQLTFAAAVLHDIAKPVTAEEIDGRVTNRGHSRIGAIMARQLLRSEGVHPHDREQICAMIERHQVPFWLYEKDRAEAQRVVASQSVSGNNRLLTVLAAADARGRICDDRGMLELGVAEYASICQENDCLDGPFPFFGERERFMFLSGRANIDPRYKLGGEEDAPVVTIMSGLPGSGKSTWVREHASDLPLVSLDAIRRAMKIDPAKPQGPVIEAARDLARDLCRQRKSFVWDGTNLSRDIRGKTIDLCRLYGYRIHIVAIDPPEANQLSRNRDREHAVPEEIVNGMLRKWEFPRPEEFHRLIWVTG